MGNTSLKKRNSVKRSAPKKEDPYRALYIWFAPLVLAGGAGVGLWPMLCAAGGFDARLLTGAVNLAVYAAVGALAVGIAPVGKKLLFCCGLLPFALQMACQPAPESLLLPLVLLFCAQTLSLAFLPVRACGWRWAFYVLNAAVLGWLCWQYRTGALPVLLTAGIIPLRRWIPRSLQQPASLPAPESRRQARRLNALGRVLSAAACVLWFAAAVFLVLRVLPAPAVLRSLAQTPPETLLAEAGQKTSLLLRMMSTGIYPDAFAAGGSLLYNSIFGPLDGVLVYTAALPLAWGLLLCSALPAPACRLRPCRRQRLLVLCTGIPAIAGSFAAYLVWGQPVSAALTLLCLAPPVLWALTPDRLVLRRSRPGRLAAAAALLLAVQVLPGVLAAL